MDNKSETTATNIYCTTFNQEEYNELLNLLVVNTEDDNPLYMKMRSLQFNPIAQAMMFINVYDIEQVYGGSEEGDWYYHTWDCRQSFGFDCYDHDGKNQFDFLIDQYANICEAYDMENKWAEWLTAHANTEHIKSLINQDIPFHLLDVDKYGEGRCVSIEYAPALSHNTSKQHYE